MKKAISLFLVLALSLSLCVPVQAEQSNRAYEYSAEEIFSVLFHENRLEEYGISPNRASERKKMPAKIEKALSKAPVFIKQDGGLVKSPTYLVTNTKENAKYIYYGETKNNRPHGFGVLCKGSVSLSDLSTLQRLVYAGNFSKGQFDGYGASFYANQDLADYDYVVDHLQDVSNPDLLAAYYMSYVTYDGNWKKSSFAKGKANVFSVDVFTFLVGGIHQIYGSSSDLSTLLFNYKTSNSGSAKMYVNDWLGYDGEIKGQAYDGTGTSYYENGNIKYKGKWKNGVYHGKGTLYDENGHVIYSGKWKKGDYAS